jgi:hypothetical protein
VKNKENVKNIITGLYFAVAMAEVTTEAFAYKPLLFVLKPLISVLLMALYWSTSEQRNKLFFATIFFSLITNVFFIPNTETMLFLGLIAFLIHRILMIFYINKLTKVKDYIPLLIATVPFLFIFFYLLSISEGLTSKSYNILILQNILISILGGISLSHYVMNDVKKNTWLLIFGLLSVTQYFIVFIEKYYLSNLAPAIFRPLAMLLNITLYYAFYRFVMDVENSNSGVVLNNN